MSKVALSIVIVSYRCARLLRDCLSSLRADRLTEGDVEAIVVDSASGDDTPAMVRREFPEVRLLESAENGGFARGNNAGIALARGGLILLLNPDTVVPPGAVRALARYLEARPAVAAVGPRLVYPDGSPQVGCQRFPTLATEAARQWMPLARPLGLVDRGDAAPRCAGPVDWVSGACLLVRRRALDRVGGLDEGFFLYFEETDWCLRARRAGLEVHHVPETAIVHVGGGSAAAAGVALERARVSSRFRESRRRYFRKHHGRLVAAAVEAVHAVRDGVRRVKAALGARRP